MYITRLTTMAALCVALHGPSVAAQATATNTAAAPTTLRAQASEWVLQAPGGTLRSAQLLGAELQLAGGLRLRIDGAQLQSDAAGRTWWAHELVVHHGAQGWQPLCTAHSDGTRYAVVLPGREQTDGLLADDADSFAISCTNGALAKCLRMGYQPWLTTPQGQALRPAFNACVRMVRGDYGGQGHPHTENGRAIDVYDDLGVQSADQLPGQAFEAGWNENGAVCVHHPRVAGKLSLAELEARYPALRGRVGATCTEAFARAHGAQVFNRSDPTSGR